MRMGLIMYAGIAAVAGVFALAGCDRKSDPVPAGMPPGVAEKAGPAAAVEKKTGETVEQPAAASSSSSGELPF